MLSTSVEAAINEQINKEFAASYLYLGMSAHFDAEGLSGFASWMRAQSQEETMHGMKLFDYVLARGGATQLAVISAPPARFGTPAEVMQQVLEHEQAVTKLINDLYGKAAKEGDYVTTAQLQWFLTEQVEEEKSASDIVQRLRLANGDPNALLLLDRELGTRTG